MIQAGYGITVKPVILRNAQVNSILERDHQIRSNIIRTFKVQEMALDDENPWDRILSSAMFALRAMVYATMLHTPEQLVVERDSTLNTRHIAY